jgi:gluconolactonase
VPKRRGVGGIALHADGGVVVSGRDIVHVRDGVTRTLVQHPGLPGWNDLCTDAQGWVYAGALRFAVFDPNAEPVPGECFQIRAEGDASVLYGGVLHGNGIAFSPSGARSTTPTRARA